MHWVAIKSIIETCRKNHLLRNTFWVLLGQSARIPIQALYFILIARSLGVQGYGAFVGVTALVAIVAPFSSVGSGDILIKNVSRDHSSFSLYWGKALVVTVVIGAFLVMLVSLLSRILLPSSIPFLLILSVSVADLIFYRILDVSVQAFQALQQLAFSSQIMVVPNVTRLLGALIAVVICEALNPIVWGYLYLISTIFSAVNAIVVVNTRLGMPVFDRRIIFSELKQGFYFSISLSSQNIYNDIDKTMLTRMSTLESAGIYGAAYRIIDVSFKPICSLLYAAYARFFQHGINGIRGTLSLSLKLLPYALIYGLLASITLYISAPILPLVLGNGYSETVSALRWLSVLPIIKAIHYFAANSLTGAGFQGIRSFLQLLTAIINILLVVWLIPLFSWKGAAWASILSDLLLAIMLWGVVIYIGRKEGDAELVLL